MKPAKKTPKKTLWQAARKAREEAYAPYSKYRVGAALRAGRHIVSGCNVENASFPAGLCAEGTAIVKAVSEGKLKRGKLDELCVVTASGGTPCGVCLQRLAEFARPDTRIVIATPQRVVNEYTFVQLNPHAFTPDDL